MPVRFLKHHQEVHRRVGKLGFVEYVPMLAEVFGDKVPHVSEGDDMNAMPGIVLDIRRKDKHADMVTAWCNSAPVGKQILDNLFRLIVRARTKPSQRRTNDARVVCPAI